MGLKGKLGLMGRSVLRPGRALTVLNSLRDGQFGTRVKSPFLEGMELLLPDEISILLFMGRPYEPDVVSFMDEVLEAGMTVFDVGAHIGFHSLGARKKVGVNGKIISFEPIPEVHEVLSSNVGLYDNIFPESLAINDGLSENLLLKYFGIRYSGLTTAYEPRFTRKWSELPKPTQRKVPAVSIDDYVNNSGLAPDLVKLDVEGCEMQALQGAQGTIEKYRPYIILEGGDIGRDDITSTRACLDYLDSFGYGFFEFDQSDKKIKKHIPIDNYGFCNLLAVSSVGNNV